jgi:uncharacterized membrane protein
MDQKTISWVSYLTIIGWIIALVTYNGSADKSSLARLHIRQMLGIMILSFGIVIVSTAVSLVLGSGLGGLIGLLQIVTFVLWLIGLIAAVNGQEKPIPVFGDFCNKTFTFIK